jgi:hypothetical protein
MNGLDRTLWLVGGSVHFLVIWPSSLIYGGALVSTTVAWFLQRPDRRWRPRYWFVATHILFFVAVVALGVLRASPFNKSTPHPRDEWASQALMTLLWGSCASCAFWIFYLKEFRWFATGLMLLLEAPVLTAVLMADISIASDLI